MTLSSVLLVMLLLLMLTLITLFLFMTITVIVLPSHTQGNLLNSLAGNSNTTRTVTFLIRSSQDQIALVRISVPGLDPSGTMLGFTDGTDSGVNVTGCDLGRDHVMLVTSFGVIAPTSVIANDFELRSTIF